MSPSRRGFLYLTAVIDWYSRCIVGWEVDDTLDTRMVITTLKKAFKVAKPQILNSDQGCQFTSQQYIDFVKENGIRQSMDGKSRWADNIMIERWFRSFKYEEAYLTQYNNIREARSAIGKYIHTYNFKRRHSALDYQTPAECPIPSLGGREEVSLTPMQSSRPEMPLSGIRLTWIARNSPIHHLLGLSIFAACLIRSYIGYVPEMPSMKLSSSTLGECSSLNG